jgi:predicted branched-subunit amino acid permease
MARTSQPPGAAMTARNVARQGFRQGIGLPSVIVLTSMMGFGSLAADGGISLPTALSASALIWGLPGQVAMAELWAAGASLIAVVLAASLANARFMPMAMSLFPLMRGGTRHPGVPYLLVQLLSVNTWVACQEAFPAIPMPLRYLYYTVFASTILVAGQVGTALGFVAVAALPEPLTLGLIFLNPCYFALLFAGTRARPFVAALLLGAFTGPILYKLIPEWSLLLTGLIAGSAGFYYFDGGRSSRPVKGPNP